ncbi:MAG: tetratricopeptide repeat protein, partial [Acidobacteriota bacterium]|nr:tetratricopeptide repeat protein [Acidobacteriota bacterium]
FGLIRALGGTRWETLAATVLFAAHPVHTEAVSWIVGRAEILAGVFCILAFICWIRFRQTDRMPYLILTGLTYFLALGAKENSAPLPAVLLLGEALGLFRSRDPAKSVAGHLRPLLTYFVMLGTVFFGYFLLRMTALGQFGIDARGLAFAGDSIQTRWASTLFGIGHYLHLSILPTELRIDYLAMKIHSLLDWRVLLSLGIMAVLGFLAFRLRRSAPRVTFWLGWFALFLLPISNLAIQIGTFLAERFLFLPSAAFCALLGTAFAYGLSDERQQWVRRLSVLSAVALLTAFCLITVDRNRDWRDPERFWRRALAQEPVSQKPYYELGKTLWDLGRERGAWSLLDESDKILEAGMALNQRPDWRLTSDHVLIVQDLANRSRERGQLEKAFELYQQIIPLTQSDPEMFRLGRSSVLGNFGRTLDQMGRMEEALSVYELAIASGEEENLAGALMLAGTVLHRMGDFEAAVERHQESLQANPSLGQAYFNLAMSLFQLKRWEEAFDSLAQAQQLGIADLDQDAQEGAQLGLREALTAKDYAQAIRITQYLLKMVVETAQDAYSQGLYTEQLGDTRTARIHYQRALSLDPSHEETLSALERLGDGVR